MAIEIEGKVIKVLPEQKGEGKNGPWTKQEFVIETFGQYPSNIVFNGWNDKADQIKKLGLGDLVKVNFMPSSREYMDRWYTELRAIRIDKLGAMNMGGGAQQSQPQAQAQQQYQSQPSQASQATVSENFEVSAPTDEDDLPF